MPGFNRKTAFIRISKTGTCSVLFALHELNYRIRRYPSDNQDELFLLTLDNIRQHYQSGVYKNYYIFTLIRNPLDRYISGWKYCIKREWLDPEYDPLRLLQMARDGYNFGGGVQDHCLTAQSHYLLFNGELVPDNVIRIEDYEMRMQIQMEYLGVKDFPLIIGNASTQDPRTTEYFLLKYPELAELHSEVFKADWDLLPYSMP